jgi:hypothetical protein
MKEKVIVFLLSMVPGFIIWSFFPKTKDDSWLM